MNILHFTYSLTPGGRRNAIINLANGLDKIDTNNYACSISTLSKNDSDLLNKTCIKEASSLNATGRYLTQKSSLLKKLSAICLKNKIDLIHTHDAASQILAAFLHKSNKSLPHVYTFHRSLDSDTAGIKNVVRNFYANKYTNVITVGSNDRKQHISKNNIFLKNEKIKLIPFGIDIDAYKHSIKAKDQLRNKYSINTDDIVIGSIGHYGKEKGIDIIIKTFHEVVKKRDKNIKLIILGKGNDQQTSYINDLIDNLQLSNNIILPGFDSSIAKWYSCFDIFAHTPREEAFGLVLVEAMASGLPVISVKIGGITDIVDHEKSGYLVEPHDIEQLSKYMLSLVDSENERLKLGKYGYDLALSKYS